MGMLTFTETQSFPSSRFPDFYISSYEDTEPEDLKRIDPHSHTYFEIIWVKEGKGVHVIDFKEYPFSGPCLFLLHPRCIHTIYKEEATQGGVLKFSSSFFDRTAQQQFMLTYPVFDDTDVLPVIQLSEEDEKSLEAIFLNLLEESKRESAFAKNILTSYLEIFLLKIYEMKKRQFQLPVFSNVELERFRSFQWQLEKHFKKMHRVQEYAGVLAISAKTLNNLTLKFTHKPPQQLINERLLLEAKRLLYHSSLTVKQIADQLGFSDSAYFNRFFKKHLQLPPEQYRKKEPFN